MGNLFSSYLPKIAGLIGAIGAALTASGDTTWGPLFTSVGILMMGLVTRQVNVSSEQSGVKQPEVVVIVEPPVIKVVEKPFVPPPGHGGQR